MKFLVVLGKGVGEASRDAMLFVQSNGTFYGIVADGVSMCEVFGDNARTGLIFLSEIAVIAFPMVCIRSRSRSSELVEPSCA